jgi:hypothetical protein
MMCALLWRAVLAKPRSSVLRGPKAVKGRRDSTVMKMAEISRIDAALRASAAALADYGTISFQSRASG